MSNSASEIDRTTDAPRLPEQLADVLRRRIGAGRYRLRVPSIVALAKEFDVGRSTAWQALKSIEAAGLVELDPGRGYFLAEGAAEVARGDESLADLAASRAAAAEDDDDDQAPVLAG